METDPLSLPQAVAYVEKCKNDGAKILGVEHILLIEGKFIPDLEEVIDLSMFPELSRDTKKDAEAIIEFMENVSTNHSYFTIVTE